MSFLATPLGYVMRFIYGLVSNYFVAIFLFTFLIRLILFPFSLQSQRKQSQRIRLAPRMERLQKKYKNDPKKLQEKQQALYEKEGVSMTAGCLPMIIQMVVLFGVIAVIYQPLTYLTTGIPDTVVEASIAAVNKDTYDDKGAYTAADGAVYTVDLSNKLESSKLSGYYGELNMMGVMDENHDDIVFMIEDKTGCSAEEAQGYYKSISAMREEFRYGKYSLLEEPWGDGFSDISLLWLIPIFSGLTSLLVSLISMHFSKQGMSQEKQPGQGCSNVMMMVFMPLFSLYIAFTVPGGVGVYWICSNVIALIQTLVLNMIYNPKKIRAQAEAEYEERRRLRAEEKRQKQAENKLAEARRRDENQEKAEEERAARRAAEEEANPGTKEKKDKARDLKLEMGAVKKDPKPQKTNSKKAKKEKAAKTETTAETADSQPEEKEEKADD